MSYAKPNIYSFINEINKYKKYEEYIEQYPDKVKYKNSCYSFTPDVNISTTETANKICAKFINFYQFIISNKSQSTKSLDNDDFTYLNYWLNSKLRNDTLNHNITVKKFHEKMSDHEEEFINDIFKGKLYDLDYEDFKNMNLLSNLYDNYGKIYQETSKLNEEKILCMSFFHKYIDTYEKGIIKCPHDETAFCKALKHLKDVYEKYVFGNYGASENCIDKQLLKLPTYNDALLEYKNINVVGSILGPSFATLFASVFLYMFTPFGQWVRAKIRTNKESHNNIYEENDSSLLSTLDNNNMNFDENAYIISYDSMGNL
ncbi:PIR Superfamily Protein [Plasmodium ovale wallikeri]|uniref:PIR Superfamily Protein n=1 Tax=Plasmodium ovale wallikeri TaxID=864142 RepID=A0A1A9AEL2_PLAOA|nr:PIR Superfamily Protein [Plasmodium ovale wallikeri]SBT57527.1 PIR Superfamily Protein [Plasmodium ovale wallikeri]